MRKGLPNDGLRRQYLRDAIVRSGRKVNGAHIFLAGILVLRVGTGAAAHARPSLW